MMPTEPKRPETEVMPEAERIIRERLATFDQDAKKAEDASVVMGRLRAQLKTPQPH